MFSVICSLGFVSLALTSTESVTGAEFSLDLLSGESEVVLGASSDGFLSSVSRCGFGRITPTSISSPVC